MEASNTAQYWIDQVKQSPYRALSAGIGIGSLQTPSEKSPGYVQAQKVAEIPPLYNTPPTVELPEISIEQNQSAQFNSKSSQTKNSFLWKPSALLRSLRHNVGGLFISLVALVTPARTKIAKQQTTATTGSGLVKFFWAILIDLLTVTVVLFSLMIATGYLTGTFDKGFKLALIGKDPIFRWVFKLKAHEIASTMLGLYMLYWIIFRIVVGKTLGQVVMTEDDVLDT